MRTNTFANVIQSSQALQVILRELKNLDAWDREALFVKLTKQASDQEVKIMARRINGELERRADKTGQ